MHSSIDSARRPGRGLGWILLATVVLAAGLAAPGRATAQVITGGDFDICDYCGDLRSNTMFLRGRAGFGTNFGEFILINGTTVAHDVDADGYDPSGVAFTDLIVAQIAPFVNVRDPSKVIAPANFVLADFLNPLNPNAQNAVNVSVNVPSGTPAGIYVGEIQIRDTVKLGTINANGELLRVDRFRIQVEVVPNAGFALVQGDAALALDSLILRGRAGQTVSDVVRIANLGNTPLTNVRVEATDLVATSGTGLRIRSERISFSPDQITSVDIGDTSRVTVTVRIPLGILAGAYRGELIVQADEVGEQRIPLTVIVTTEGDIVFLNNPVFGLQDDRAVIIFNADPSSQWVIHIYDMQGIEAFRDAGTVFAGGTTGGITVPGDEAIRYTWNLRNGRGEAVAAGMYYVVIETIQDGRGRQLRDKLMVIR
jgi:hypothetical protein